MENRSVVDGYNVENIIFNKYVQSWFYVMYTFIFVLGIFGNMLVCFVVLRSRAMQTVTNLFITNLALSDILLCILAVPFTPLYTFHAEWLFGNTICHLVPVSQAISVYISTLTLTSIAIDRYFVIIHPFHPRMQKSTCISIIVSIWIFSFLVTLPYGIYMERTELKDNASIVYYCEERWPSDRYRQAFGVFTTLMQFIIPFILIAYCYTNVSSKLNARVKAKPGVKSSKREEADRERKKRTNRMLIAMVAIFLISWLPLNAINIISDFYHHIMEWPFYLFCFIVVHSMAMSSTCYNPFLYAWLNDNFRKEFINVLPCFDAQQLTSNARFSNYKLERTCNGNNETQLDSLLPGSFREHMTMLQSTPLKIDNIELEDVIVSYDTVAETVRLKLITEEDPPAYDLLREE